MLAYATLSRQHAGSEPAALLHRSEHVAAAQRRLHAFLRELLTEGARAGELRDDVPADELAGYVIGALSAAGALTSQAAVGRLVTVTLAGLRAG
jgi:hypothetical protein